MSILDYFPAMHTDDTESEDSEEDETTEIGRHGRYYNKLNLGSTAGTVMLLPSQQAANNSNPPDNSDPSLPLPVGINGKLLKCYHMIILYITRIRCSYQSWTTPTQVIKVHGYQ